VGMIVPGGDIDVVGRIADHELDRLVRNFLQHVETIADRDDVRGRTCDRRQRGAGRGMCKPALAQAVHADMPGVAMGAVRHDVPDAAACYSLRAIAVSRFMFCNRMRPRCRSRMPSLRQLCSCRLTLSRAAPTKMPSCSCEMCTSEPKSAASAQSRRASRTGSGCSMDSSIRSLCQRIRWPRSWMILIATVGSG